MKAITLFAGLCGAQDGNKFTQTNDITVANGNQDLTRADKVCCGDNTALGMVEKSVDEAIDELNNAFPEWSFNKNAGGNTNDYQGIVYVASWKQGQGRSSFPQQYQAAGERGTLGWDGRENKNNIFREIFKDSKTQYQEAASLLRQYAKLQTSKFNKDFGSVENRNGDAYEFYEQLVALKGDIKAADDKFKAIMNKKDEAEAMTGVENFDKLKLDFKDWTDWQTGETDTLRAEADTVYTADTEAALQELARILPIAEQVNNEIDQKADPMLASIDDTAATILNELPLVDKTEEQQATNEQKFQASQADQGAAEKALLAATEATTETVDAAAQKVADAAYGSTAVAEEAAVMNEDLKTSGNNALTQIDDEKTDAMGTVSNNAENVMEGMDKMWGDVESVEDTMKGGLSSSVDRVSTSDSDLVERVTSFKDMVNENRSAVMETLSNNLAEADQLAAQVNEVNDAVERLHKAGNESVKLLNSTAKEIIGQVRYMGKQSRAEAKKIVEGVSEKSFEDVGADLEKDAFSFEDAAAEELYKAEQALVPDPQIDQKFSDVMAKSKLIYPRLKGFAKSYLQSLDKLDKQKMKMTDQWETVKHEELGQKQNFQLLVDAAEAKLLRKIQQVGQTVQGAQNRFNTNLNNAQMEAGEILQNAKDNSESRLQGAMQDIMEKVQTLAAKTSPQDARNAILEFQGKLASLPDELEELGDNVDRGWRDANTQEAQLEAQVNQTRALLSNQLTFESGTTLDNVRSTLEKIYSEAEDTLKQKMADVSHEAGGLIQDSNFHREVSAAEAQLEALFQNKSREVQAVRTSLNEEKLRLAAEIAAHDTALTQRKAALEQAGASEDAEVESFVTQAEGATNDELASFNKTAQGFLSQIKSQGEDLRPRVSAAVDSYVKSTLEGVQAKLNEYEANRNSLDPSGVKKAFTNATGNEEAADKTLMSSISSEDAALDAEQHAQQSREGEVLRNLRQSNTNTLTTAQAVFKEAQEAASSMATDVDGEVNADIRAKEAKEAEIVKTIDETTKTAEAKFAAEAQQTDAITSQVKATEESEADAAEAGADKAKHLARLLGGVGEERKQFFLKVMGVFGEIEGLGLDGSKTMTEKVTDLMKDFLQDVQQNLEIHKADESEKIRKLAASINDKSASLVSGLKPSDDALSDFEAEVQALSNLMQSKVPAESDAAVSAIANVLQQSTTAFTDALAEQEGAAKADLAKSSVEATASKASQVAKVLQDLSVVSVQNANKANAVRQLHMAQEDAKMEQLLRLENYQESSVVQRIKDDMIKAKREVDAFRKWRGAVVVDAKKYRQDVEDAWRGVGVALRAEGDSWERAEVAQKWAIEHTIEHMSKELAGDVGALSKADHAMLAGLAKEAGAQIAAVMKMQNISDAERARRIAKIKADAVANARAALAASQEMQLKQADLERKMSLAMVDLEGTMLRVAALTQGKSGAAAVPRRSIQSNLATISGAVARIRAAQGLDATGADPGAGDAAGSPDALLEEGATPSAPPEDIRTALSEDKEWLEQFSAPNRTA